MLSHLLIRRLAFASGYASAALQERIYAHSGRPDRTAGILIYTAAGDAQGTLGGLVRLGAPDKVLPLMLAALSDGDVCSNDPVCIESDVRALRSSTCPHVTDVRSSARPARRATVCWTGSSSSGGGTYPAFWTTCPARSGRGGAEPPERLPSASGTRAQLRLAIHGTGQRGAVRQDPNETPQAVVASARSPSTRARSPRG
ncbi:DUF1998 domain-containing protein [Streptomyces sp. NPDC001553]|uniref:DUF1998 domain-containing protein n=1 Tax=Streptomyces sp. NPDC001553 TaxID=3154385 RepID=UPI00331740B6